MPVVAVVGGTGNAAGSHSHMRPLHAHKRTAKLVTGSLEGVLRVHLPHGRGYHLEDCLLETQLEAGILQLEIGRFAG